MPNGQKNFFKKLKMVAAKGIEHAMLPFAIIFASAAVLFYKAISFLRLKFFKRQIFKGKYKILTQNQNEGFDAEEQINRLIGFTGFQYELKQDMFYSAHDAWQKKYGYCQLYDISAVLFGMVVDSEPVYFDYGGKAWLIEFWKGQYDLTTGCEIGIYTTKEPGAYIPGVFNFTFYSSGDDEDKLRMSFTLLKNGSKLFKRTDKHWWLTGFKLGEFSNPEELTMKIAIEFKNREMRDAFAGGLKNLGYPVNKIKKYGNAAGFIFDKPHFSHTILGMDVIRRVTQIKNKFMCDKYREITEAFLSMPDKLAALAELSPELYSRLMNIGKAGKNRII